MEGVLREYTPNLLRNELHYAVARGHQLQHVLVLITTALQPASEKSVPSSCLPTGRSSFQYNYWGLGHFGSYRFSHQRASARHSSQEPAVLAISGHCVHLSP